jgi:hypothetical protein
MVTAGIGKAAQAKHSFRVGMNISGEAQPAANPRTEPAEFYKLAKLKVLDEADSSPEPPWTAVPPPLEVYRERGHRRLSASTYDTKCSTCTWGCKMAVEMIVDQCNPSQVRYRTETFCYGPKSCRFYKAGPARKVPGRKGMSWTEEDWVDEDATAHRGEDD